MSGPLSKQLQLPPRYYRALRVTASLCHSVDREAREACVWAIEHLSITEPSLHRISLSSSTGFQIGHPRGFRRPRQPVDLDHRNSRLVPRRARAVCTPPTVLADSAILEMLDASCQSIPLPHGKHAGVGASKAPHLCVDAINGMFLFDKLLKKNPQKPAISHEGLISHELITHPIHHSTSMDKG